MKNMITSLYFVIYGKHENIDLFNLIKNYLTDNSLLFSLYEGVSFEVLLFNFWKMILEVIVYRKITWSGRLAQIQIYLEFSRVLSRDQSKCKGNYSVAHKVGRKAKDVS